MSGHRPFAALTLDRKRLGDETAPADQRTEYGEKCRNSFTAGDISLKLAHTRLSDSVGMKGNQQDQIITQTPRYNGRVELRESR